MTTQTNSESRKRRDAYIYADGNSAELKPDCQGVTFDVPNADGSGHTTVEVRFASLPENIRNAAMAFGLNTVLTNAINSAAKEGNSHERFNSRLAGFNAGEWSARGTGERSPVERKPAIILRAVAEAFAKGNVAPPKGHKDWDAWLAAFHAHWATMDKKARNTFQKKYLAFDAVNRAYIRIKKEEEAAKVAAPTAKLNAATLDDLAF